MKVVLFCGGLGMRLREHAQNIPKPLVKVGLRPILWNVMKYYAHFGHTDFILCLGWKGDQIKDYFLKYSCGMSDGPDKSEAATPFQSDVGDWNIKFVDTGIDANIGQRLRAVQPLLQGEEVFLANYADGLSNLPLPRLIQHFYQHQATASFVAVRPQDSWHAVDFSGDGLVNQIQPVRSSGIWMNGGFFVLHQRIFDVLEDGDELVHEPFRRLIAKRELVAYPYDGFWSCMDTYKDKQRLEDLVATGETPWEVWNNAPTACEAAAIDRTIEPPLVQSRPK